jgi:hypothetical protein
MDRKRTGATPTRHIRSTDTPRRKREIPHAQLALVEEDCPREHVALIEAPRRWGDEGKGIVFPWARGEAPPGATPMTG